MKRRNRGPSFTQLRTVPGPAHLRAQVPALPQHQPTPGHACLACGCPLTPTGCCCPHCGWTRQHRAWWEEPLPCSHELTQAGAAGPQSLFLYFVWAQAWAFTLQPKGPETQQVVPGVICPLVPPPRSAATTILRGGAARQNPAAITAEPSGGLGDPSLPQPEHPEKGSVTGQPALSPCPAQSVL